MLSEITAELVASVWQVVVKPGDTVGPGDTVVILESMKMEIPVVAETAGVVTDVKVAEGDAVAEGDVLVTVA